MQQEQKQVSKHLIEHEKCEILKYCLFSLCQTNPEICQNCDSHSEKYHSDHLDYCLTINNIIKILEDQVQQISQQLRIYCNVRMQFLNCKCTIEKQFTYESKKLVESFEKIKAKATFLYEQLVEKSDTIEIMIKMMKTQNYLEMRKFLTFLRTLYKLNWNIFSKIYQRMEKFKNEQNKAIYLNIKKQIEKAAQIYLSKSKELYNMKQYEQQILMSDEAIERNSQLIEAFIFKGLALYNLREFHNAIICYDEAIKLDSSYMYAYVNKGVALKSLNQLDEALKNYDKAIQLDEICHIAYLNKGLLLSTQGKYIEAIHCYDEAIKLEPNISNGYLYKGQDLENLGEFDEAIQFIDKALNLDPSYAQAYNSKGNVLYQLGRYNEAISNYDQAIRWDPNFQVAQRNKSSYIKSDLLELAINQLYLHSKAPLVIYK